MKARSVGCLALALALGCSAAKNAAEPRRSEPVPGSAAADATQTPLKGRPPASPPAAQRYHRGDWQPPTALVVAYDSDWRDPLTELIEAALMDVDVYVLTTPEELRDYEFFSWLARHGADVLVTRRDTPWVRDYGPVEVIDSTGLVRWVDFRYSEERPHDDYAPFELAKHLSVELETTPLWMDGGALISNGSGLCAMTTESIEVLGIDGEGQEQEVELERFLSQVGCEVLAVLPALPNEETGHADIIAQFLSDRLVAVSSAAGRAGPDVAEALDMAVEALLEAAAVLEHPLDVIRVPLDARGATFYSYVNATRLRTQILVPRYSHLADLEAETYTLFGKALPGVRVVPIQADAMVARGGAVHCLTLGLTLDGTRAAGGPNYLARRGGRRPARRWIGLTPTFSGARTR